MNTYDDKSPIINPLEVYDFFKKEKVDHYVQDVRSFLSQNISMDDDPEEGKKKAYTVVT